MAELYRNISNNIQMVLAESGRTSIHGTPFTGNYTTAVGQIFESGTNFCMGVSTTTARMFRSYSLGANSGTDREVWHNYNNQKDRLYLRVSNVKYGCIPFPVFQSTFTAAATTDGNSFGGQLKSVWWRPGSGTSTTSWPAGNNVSINRYLNIGTGNTFIPVAWLATFYNITPQTGTRTHTASHYLYDDAGTGSVVNVSTGGMLAEYANISVSLSPTAVQSRASVGNTGAVRTSMDHNNWGFTSQWSFTYAVVPTSAYTLSRLVY